MRSLCLWHCFMCRSCLHSCYSSLEKRLHVHTFLSAVQWGPCQRSLCMCCRLCVSYVWVTCMCELSVCCVLMHMFIKGKIKSIVYHPTQEFHQPMNIAEPTATCIYRILAGLSSSGKLGGREVKTSALESRRSWVWIPPESPVKFFPQTLGKHWVYSAIHVGVRAKLNQLFITRRKNFINLWISQNPLLYRILAGLSSSGKLGSREVKTSALVSRRSWVRIPPELPVKFFPTDTRKAPSIQCYKRRCKGKIKSITCLLFIYVYNMEFLDRRFTMYTRHNKDIHPKKLIHFLKKGMLDKLAVTYGFFEGASRPTRQGITANGRG